jgi:hypothetical protein
MTAERHRITRRPFLPAAAGVLGGTAAAEALGSELRGGDHSATKPASAGKPASTAAADPPPISPFVRRPDLRPPTMRVTPQSIAERAWAGFETAIVTQEGGAHFQAVALDAHGNELGRSAIV